MEKQKDYNIEFLRFIATVGVIFVHVGVCWISAFGKNASSFQRFEFATVQHSMFWAVPVFMMITGSLMMQKPKISYQKAFGYFKRMAVLLVLFGTVFAWMELYFKFHTINAEIMWGGIFNMLTGCTWKHLWYLYMLLGIYLVLPILNSLNNLRLKELLVFVVCVFVFNSLLPTFGLSCGIDFPIASIYIGYFLTGYLVVKLNCRNLIFTRPIVTLPILLLTFFLLIGDRYMTDVLGKNLVIDSSSYSSLFTVVQSVILFWLFTRRKGCFDKFCNMWLIRRFNRCSLGIYIIHMLWINIIIKVFHVDIMPYGLLGIIPVGIIVFLLAWVTTECMIKVPILKRYL